AQVVLATARFPSETMTGDDGTVDPDSSSTERGGAAVVLKPARSVYLRAVRVNAFLAVPLLIVGFLRLQDSPWLVPVVIGMIAVSLGGVLLYFRNSRIELRDGAYRVVNALGRTRDFRAPDVERAVVVTQLVAYNAAPAPHLRVEGTDGTALLKIPGSTWSTEAITALADDLAARGRPVVAIDEPITLTVLREHYPALVSWWEAHPFLVGILGAVGLIAVIVVIVLLVQGGIG
ncbi:MAG: hypothetical protein ABW004_14490, partial [Aeromicrobium sp.]